jgi:hypothetical protein
MTRYALNLPNELKRDAERLAREQGVSLNQFILWSVAEKVGGLLQGLGSIPQYHHLAAAKLLPCSCSGIRVQTIALASQNSTL